MTRPALRINQQVLPYLSTLARAKLEELTAAGVDPDLALTMVETFLPEQDAFELPPREAEPDDET